MSQGIWPILCLCLLSFFSQNTAHANTAQGRVWLAAQARTDGVFASADDLATPFQATAEALRTLNVFAESSTSDQSAGLAFLERETFAGTEYLARCIIARSEAGQDAAALFAELLAHYNPDGGFGDLTGFASNVRDTAWALIALASIGETTDPTTQAAIGYLLNRQDPEGGWAEASNPPSIELTALALHALWHLRQAAAVEDAITHARSYLLAERSANGAWGETFVSAQVLIAILPTLDDLVPVTAAVTVLQAAQTANGSWDNDVFSTALALRALYAATPQGLNPDLGTLRARIVDSASGFALAGVTINLAGTVTDHRVTGSDGTFTFAGLPAGSYQLEIYLADYTGLTATLQIGRGDIVDLGDLFLKPDNDAADTLGPDLSIAAIDTGNVDHDPGTFALGGSLEVILENRGNNDAAAGFILSAFVDSNNDGIFSAAIDRPLGESRVSTPLAALSTTGVVISLSGQLDFRNAPITVLADSSQRVVETDETNNIASTAQTCRVQPPAGIFQPVEKWAWSSSTVLPDFVSVISTPLVVTIEDTNNDGAIDTADIPSVVFNSYVHPNFTGPAVLRAISGRDGHELWTVTDPAYATFPSSNLAAADIDADGLIEIIAPAENRILAFEHDGTFKWSSVSGIRANWGGPAIADLDGDGTPEIVIGNTVLDANGELRWQGTGFRGGDNQTGPLSVVADIDLDGRPEIIAGGSAYSAEGEILWSNATVNDGFVALGNFDTEPTPEIVVVSFGRVFLLEANGTIVWGPVALPSGGIGGPPTVADLDGDGLPEIGVAASYRYSTFDTDGSLMWATPTRDFTSHRTGSAVFDFEGDGSAEVVYADETRLRVYRGRDGSVLYEIPNTSSTSYELPVIADVDNDGQAEIIIAANPLIEYESERYTGIRVFADAAGSWVNSRRIWNQHSYHITNIGDDGVIPTQETPSWLEHNTYRLNTLSQGDARTQADVTIGRLQLVDNGTGKSFGLSVRVGNAGLFTPLAPTLVAFYQGDPDNDGLLLGEIEVASLAAGTYRDITFTGLTPNGAGIYALIDPADTLSECDETNNRVLLSEIAAAPLGELHAATDALSYGPNETVALLLTVNNQGALSADFRVSVQIEDSLGNTLATFPIRAIDALPGGAERTLSFTWNTSVTLAGDYQVRGDLLDRDGFPLGEAIAAFSINSADDAAAVGALRIITDKPLYHTNDAVHIDALLDNRSANILLNEAVLQITIANSTGQSVFEQRIDHIELAPGNTRQITLQFLFGELPEGSYLVHGKFLGGDGKLLASTQTPFGVVDQLALSLTADVSVAAQTLMAGASQTCTGSFVYQGTQTLIAQSVRLLWVDQDTGEPIASHPAQIDLQPDLTLNISQEIDTTGFVAGDYICILQAQITDEWLTLDYASFTLATEADEPGAPDTPDAPEPTDPDGSTPPGAPDPGDADEPDDPSNPDTPDEPSTPGEPDKPNIPDESDITDDDDDSTDPEMPSDPVAVPALGVWSTAILIALLALRGGVRLRITGWVTTPPESRD